MRRRVCIAVLAMGFSGLIAEILLLRELLIVFSGNELSIGIILANWLVLEALGCLFSGRMVEKTKNRLEAFTVLTVLFSTFLLAAVFLTRFLRRMLGASIGESIGLFPVFYASFLVLLPVSVLHGALFTSSCQIYALFSGQEASAAGKVYVYETVGTIVGGIVSTYFLIPHFDTFQASIWLAILNFVVCFVLLAPYWRGGRLQKVILAILGVLIFSSGYLVFAGWIDDLHHYSVQAQWKPLDVVHYQNSQYGNISVVEREGQYIYFLDGLPSLIIPIPDIPFVEEFVHFPLLAHSEPTDVLILSGGAGGMINEILKHPSIETVEYAELDPLLLSLFHKFPTPLTVSELDDARVRVKHVDGRLLLRTTPKKHDLIFVGITEPSDLQANRFFTQEFFSLAKERLNQGGILVLGAPGSMTLLNEELRDLNSCIFHTLQSVFPHVRVIPGEGTNIFLASDSQEILAIDKDQVVTRLEKRNIEAHAMVPWHIENKLHPGWQAWFADFIEGHSQKINHDFKPLALFYSLSHWNVLFAPSFGRLFRQFERINLRGIAVLFSLLLLIYFFLRWRNKTFFRTGVPLSIVTTGFAGMIFDLVVIFAFQSIYGYVFSWIGLLVASFMAGAACGAMLITKVMAHIQDDMRLFQGIELAIIGLSAVLPSTFLAINSHMGGQNVFVRVLFLFISFICGLLIGSQFPLANKLYLGHSTSLSRTAGLLYACDLLGGWMGGIVGGVVLLSVLGLAGTCITVALLKLTSFIVLITHPPLAVARRRKK
ncbi:MAG: spermine synthase [Anaerolineales bacterium]